MADPRSLRRNWWRSLAMLVVVAGGGVVAGRIDGRAAQAADKPVDAAKLPPPAVSEAVALNKSDTVFLDKPHGRVLLKTHVVLQKGPLEMLICKRQTKEHEAILSVDAQAYVIHTGLLALNAKPGTPFRIDTEYHPPTGQRIEIYLNWKDADGKPHREPARRWIRQAVNRFWSVKMDALPAGVTLPKNSELRYDRKLKELAWYGPMTTAERDEFLALTTNVEFRKAIQSFFDQSQSRELQAHWVFAGSGFYLDEDTGVKHYLAEDGDLICVANFAGAMLDLSIASSAADAERNFEAYTERIPAKETEVLVELIPVPADAPEKPSAKPPESKK